MSQRCPHDINRSKYDCCACALEEVEKRHAAEGEGHLKRWMEDATSGARQVSRMTHIDVILSESEQGDLQAARELAALEEAAREALVTLENTRFYASRVLIAKLRSALKAL